MSMRTENSNFIDLDKINCNNEKVVDTFASSTMKILDAKYKKAD
jgi:ribosomal protein S27E